MEDNLKNMLGDYVTALERENERLQQENKQLKDLCNKYEEEHKTTFETWLKEINILTELEKWLCGEKIVVYNVYGQVGILRGDILNKIQKLKEKYK